MSSHQIAFLGPYLSIVEFEMWRHPEWPADSPPNNYCIFRIDKVQDEEHAAALAPGAEELVVLGNNFIMSMMSMMSGGRIASIWWASQTLTTVSISNYKFPQNEIPTAVRGLCRVHTLNVTHCLLERVPGELGWLPTLLFLNLSDNYLEWVPSTLCCLQRKAIRLDLRWNWFTKNEDGGQRTEANLWPSEVIERMPSNLSIFCYEFTEAAIGLQELNLPALVTLEILDALCPNAVRMAAKWDLIVAVKHFRR